MIIKTPIPPSTDGGTGILSLSLDHESLLGNDQVIL